MELKADNLNPNVSDLMRNRYKILFEPSTGKRGGWILGIDEDVLHCQETFRSERVWVGTLCFNQTNDKFQCIAMYGEPERARKFEFLYPEFGRLA